MGIRMANKGLNRQFKDIGNKKMKKISFCLCCYNEGKRIVDSYNEIKELLKRHPEYDYEIIYSDNCSNDDTVERLRALAESDKKVKVILNISNYNARRSGYNCYNSASGDAIVMMSCSGKEPMEMYEKCIELWKQGNLIVFGQKQASEESGVMFSIRRLYYKIINIFSEYDMPENVIGWGIIDSSVYKVIKEIGDKDMALRHLIPELGYPITLVPYVQKQRQYGKSKHTLIQYINTAITSFIYTSRAPIRIATLVGGCGTVISICIAVVYLILKLLFWNDFKAGIAPIVLLICTFCSVQFLLMGIIGEYVGVILDKVIKRPLVIEKERINFEENRE